MVIKSRADLEDWTEYRRQTHDGLAGLQAGDSVHVSQDDFEFHISGRAWAGRIVLVGGKGDQSFGALKREGLTFRSGSATRSADGTTVNVIGISKSLVKEANKALAKLSLSMTLVAAEPGPEVDAAEAKADGEVRRAGEEPAEAGLAQRVRAAKVTLRDDIPAALADKARAPEVSRLARLAAEHERQGRLAEALAALAQLRDVIAQKTADAGSLPATATVDVDVATPDEAKAEAATRKAPLFGRVKAAVALRAELRDAFTDLLRRADKHEKAGEFAAVVAAYDELADRLDEADAAADGDAARAAAAARKAPLVQRIKAAVAARPELREPVTALLRAADGHEKVAAYAAVLTSYDALEDLIVDDAEPDDGDAAAAGVDLRDWAQYRTWLRPRLRKLSRSAAALEPVFVSRQRLEFDVDGKPWRGHLVMAGDKCRGMLQRCKREGTTFVEVAGYLRETDGKLVVDGLAAGASAAANRTLQRLRLGCRLEGADASAASTATGATGGAVTSASLAPEFASSWPPAKAAWANALAIVGGQLEQLRSHLLTTKDPELVRIAEFGLNAITGDHRVPLQVAMTEIDAAADAAKLPRIARARDIVASFQAHLDHDERVDACDGNPFGVVVTIRSELLGALTTLADVLDDAVVEPS